MSFALDIVGPYYYPSLDGAPTQENEKRKKLFGYDYVLLEGKNPGYSTEDVFNILKDKMWVNDYATLNEKYIRLLFTMTDLNKKALLTKSPEWLKEKEIRIFGSPTVTFSHLSKKNERETSFERTVYYDPHQLAGIILGIGLSESEKNEIQKIYKSKSGSLRIYQAYPIGNKINVKIIEAVNKLF